MAKRTSLRKALADASGADQVDALVTKMGEGNPLGRLADPRELGTAAVFLSSNASSFITGVELFADGGIGAATARLLAGRDAKVLHGCRTIRGSASYASESN